MLLTRRRVLTGILAAPIVVRSGLCMPVSDKTWMQRIPEGAMWYIVPSDVVARMGGPSSFDLAVRTITAPKNTNALRGRVMVHDYSSCGL